MVARCSSRLEQSSLEESRPKGDGPSHPTDGYPEDRLLEAKAAMKMTAEEFPGDLEWNIETLISEAVTESLEECKAALAGERESLTEAMEAHVLLRKTLNLPPDDTGTYMARTFIQTRSERTSGWVRV